MELLTADLDDPVASHVVVRVGGVQSGRSGNGGGIGGVALSWLRLQLCL